MTDAEMEKIWNNLKRNLKSYCDENGFSDVMLGLSGGLDSAIVSVLACDALGAEHVHALMMKTDYTSELSLQIAAKIAALNGFDYKVVDIQPVIDNKICTDLPIQRMIHCHIQHMATIIYNGLKFVLGIFGRMADAEHPDTFSLFFTFPVKNISPVSRKDLLIFCPQKSNILNDHLAAYLKTMSQFCSR